VLLVQDKLLILYLTTTKKAMGYVQGQHDESDRKESNILSE
jgi:hypothetical protein